MSSASEPSALPTVRALVRWRLPLHYVIPVVTALMGLLLLLLGGTPAFFGGWWLATALPIALGAFFQVRWLALLPVAFWTAWWIVGSVAGDGAALANTPLPVAVFLASIGAGATVLAQRAVFPVTDPEAWEASTARTARGPGAHHSTDSPKADDPDAPLDPDLHPAPDLVDASDDLDPALAEAFEEPFDGHEELSEEPAGAVAVLSTEPEAETGADGVAGAGPEAEAEAGKLAETGAKGVAEAGARPQAEGKPAPAEPGAEGKPAPAEPRAECKPAPAGPEAGANASLDASSDAPAAAPQPEAAPVPDGSDPIPVSELPLDADPAPLDEGGHVTEFNALTEADLQAPLPAATEAARRRAGR